MNADANADADAEMPMPRFPNAHILLKRVTDIYIKVKTATSKLHNTSIAFIKIILFVDLIAKHAVVKGQFINEMDSLTASRNLTKSHLTKHAQDQCNIMT